VRGGLFGCGGGRVELRGVYVHTDADGVEYFGDLQSRVLLYSRWADLFCVCEDVPGREMVERMVTDQGVPGYATC
jgi:hypothetical protein